MNGVSGSPNYFAANRELVLAILRGMVGPVREVNNENRTWYRL